MITLNIAPLSQRDNRWKNQRLGTVNGTTIGSDGCVVTCHSMKLTYHGFPILPNKLDDLLTDKKLYYEGRNLWMPANAPKIWDKYKFVRTIYCDLNPAPIEDIKRAIDNKQPPTLWLINEGVRHNVLAVGYEGNQIIVNDPWIGDTVRIDKRWGDSATKILSVDFYEGPVPVEAIPSMSTPMSDQDKKDIESMRKLREYNGVFYEAKHVIDFIEALKIERNKLGLEISKKDDKIKELEKQIDDGNDWKSKYDTLELNTDQRIQAEREKAQIDMQAQLKIQENNFIERHAAELNDLREKITELEDREPTKIIEKETPLEDRFAGKPLKEKVLACIDILFSKPQKNEK